MDSDIIGIQHLVITRSQLQGSATHLRLSLSALYFLIYAICIAKVAQIKITTAIPKTPSTTLWIMSDVNCLVKDSSNLVQFHHMCSGLSFSPLSCTVWKSLKYHHPEYNNKVCTLVIRWTSSPTSWIKWTTWLVKLRGRGLLAKIQI